MTKSTYSHALHDLGLAVWCGGTLANAVALNAAAGEADDPSAVGAVANAGWDRWTPVNAAAIGIHLVGSVGLVLRDAPRMSAQQGVGSMAALKTALTVGALGATAYSRVLGRKVSQHHAVPAQSGTEPAAATPPEIASAQRQLKALQWVVPALTGGLVVIGAYASEQYRVSEVKPGVLKRVLP
jgi:predicted component of type VI protein secretion system